VKKTFRERGSRLQGMGQLLEQLPRRVLRLLCPIGEWRAAPCVLAAVPASSAPLAPTALCEAIASAASPTEPPSPSAPRFAPSGPDAADYGASDGDPIGARSTFLRTPFLVGSSSHLDHVFEGRLVRRAPAPSPLARAASQPAVRYAYRGHTCTRDDDLTRHPATGRLVARGDTILLARDQYARHDRHRFTSWSRAKTVPARLVGTALAQGHIRSVDDPAAAHVPALAGPEYGRTSLRHVLQMSSGVRFVEEDSGRDDVSRLVADPFRQQVGAGGVEAVLPFHVREAPSGPKFSSAAVETRVLGLVLRAVVGRPVADDLHEKLWGPMGAEADATWLIDRAGQEATYCCLDAGLRDDARRGLLLAHGGHWRGRQRIPRTWIEDATRGPPDPAHLQPGTARPFVGYGDQVWRFPGERRMFALLGVRGPALFVDPARRLVMVHTAVRTQPRAAAGAEAVALWQSLVRELGN
jgi:CubicO group peptidase (beta-lactamase class C family)